MLLAVGERFTQVYRTLEGLAVLGSIVPISETPPGGLFAKNRVFRVSQNAKVESGDIIVDPINQGKYLLARGADDTMGNSKWKRYFYCIELTSLEIFTREITENHPVSRVPVNKRWEEYGREWIRLEPLEERIERGPDFSIPFERVRVYTRAAVALKDRVGPWMVNRVFTHFGVSVVDAS